jgi:ribosome-associated protein
MIERQTLKNLRLIATLLADKKGFNILVLDVRGLSTLTDFFVIAEGMADRHVSSLGKEVVTSLKEQGVSPIHVEGLSQGDWVVIDYMDIVVHIFLPTLRDAYRIEQLWSEGKIVELNYEVV